jgi:maltose O-acetyltransferase
MRSHILYFYTLISLFLPQSRFFSLKAQLLRLAGASVGRNVRIISSARFATSGSLEIGKDTFIGHDVMILGGTADIKIGEGCDIAPRVLLVTGSHKIDSVGPKAAGEGFSSPISIAAGCWLCASSTILGGTQIGSHSVVVAGSVVRGTFPPYSLIAGNPAILVKTLPSLTP